MVKVFNKVIKFNRFERFFFLNSLACNFLHDWRVVHRNNSECSRRTSLGASSIRHRERNLFSTVPHLARSLHRHHARLGHFNLEVLIAREVHLQIFKAVIRVRNEFRNIERLEFALFLNSLVCNLLDFRKVVHRFHSKESCRSGLSTFRVRYGKRDFFGAIPVLVRDDNRCNLVRIDIDLEFRFSLLGTRSRLRRNGKRKFRELVIHVLDHVAKLDRLELALFANGLRHNLSYEHRQIVHRFNRKVDRAFIAGIVRVTDLERNSFGTMPLRRRRSDTGVMATINSNLEFLVASNRPLEASLCMVRIFNMVVEFNRLEFALFLDGLFADILHDRRIVNSLYRELRICRCTSAFRVSCRKGQCFRAIPLFMRNLHGNFVRSVVDIDLEIAIARHFNFELGEVVIGIAQVIVQNERRKFILFFNRLVSNLLENRRVVHGANVQSNILLCRTAFRVHYSERCNRIAKPARVRDFNRSHMLFVDRNVERSRFRHLALVLDFDIPRKFRILVVFILDKVIKFDLIELLLFVDVLVRNRADELRQVVYRVDREHGFAFCRSAFRVRSLELDGFRAVPHLVRNANRSNAARNRNLQVLSSSNSPLEHFDAVVRILHVLAQLNRSKFLLFIDGLIRNVLNKFRSIILRIHLEQNILFSRSASSVRHGKRHTFLTVPVFVRDGHNRRTVLVELNLQILIARHGPLEFHDIVIGVIDIIHKRNHVELILFVDDLVRNLLCKYRRVVDRRDRKGSRLVIATVIRVIGNKLDSSGTIPVLIGNYNCCYAVSVNRYRQITISLRTASRNNFGIPCNLVFFVVRVIYKIVQANLCKLLAFFNNLARDLANHRRIVHRFNSKVHRF